MPDDPDLLAEQRAYELFSSWDRALDQAGPAAAARHLAALQAMLHELQDLPAGPGQLHQIDERIRKEL